jgi:hypothetical protein
MLDYFGLPEEEEDTLGCANHASMIETRDNYVEQPDGTWVNEPYDVDVTAVFSDTGFGNQFVSYWGAVDYGDGEGEI